MVKRLLLAALAAFLVSAPAGAGGATASSRIAFGLDLGGLSGDLTSLYTVRPDGSGLRRLTVPPTRQALGGDSGPVWAPGGKSLVFERNLPYWGSDRMRLMSVPARGGAARQLTTGPFDAMPSFSPDGRRIAFTRVVQSVIAPTASLFTMDGGGRHLEPLLADGIDLSAAWSPDGSTIAFSRLESVDRPLGEATLYLADADGSHVRSLGATPVHGVSAGLVAGRQAARVRLLRRRQRARLSRRLLPAERRALRGRRRRHRAAASDPQQGRRRASELVARRLANRLRERLRRAEPGSRAVVDGDPRLRRQAGANRARERRDRPAVEPGRRPLSATLAP